MYVDRKSHQANNASSIIIYEIHKRTAKFYVYTYIIYYVRLYTYIHTYVVDIRHLTVNHEACSMCGPEIFPIDNNGNTTHTKGPNPVDTIRTTATVYQDRELECNV